MINFNNKKTRKLMVTIVSILLVLCMVLPIVLSALL
jgi:hypothetical protein